MLFALTNLIETESLVCDLRSYMGTKSPWNGRIRNGRRKRSLSLWKVERCGKFNTIKLILTTCITLWSHITHHIVQIISQQKLAFAWSSFGGERLITCYYWNMNFLNFHWSTPFIYVNVIYLSRFIYIFLLFMGMVMYANKFKTKRKKIQIKKNNCNIYVIFTSFLVLKVSRFALAPQTRLSAPNKVYYVGSMIISLWLEVQRVRSICL